MSQSRSEVAAEVHAPSQEDTEDTQDTQHTEYVDDREDESMCWHTSQN